tara:strand:+ start:139 stop:1113 length:975 start_codon:yes stop_codon:yes gene_type:complete
MKSSCFANMRLISSIDSFKVYTDNNGFRFSGIRRGPKDNNLVFLGDSQTFGVGSDWENTFVGMLESEFEKYNFFNLAVPSYSPTVYEYILNKFLEKESLSISKIFVLIDLTDVGDEANRWEVINGRPNLKNEKIFYKKSEGFSKFKKENFKGLYLISSKLRSYLRKVKSSKNFNSNEERYKPVNGNPTGGYIYTDHNVLTGCDTIEKKTNWWKCGQIEQGLMKLEKNIINLGSIASQLNSEFYIIIMPWPDTLNFGQTKFNWEKFANNLCEKSNCKKLVNVFPKFKKIKNEEKNWLEKLYLKDDIHLTEEGNRIVADEIKANLF